MKGVLFSVAMLFIAWAWGAQVLSTATERRLAAGGDLGMKIAAERRKIDCLSNALPGEVERCLSALPR